ncbi:MAG TPA: uracil-DNA glycosylase [Candidatus Paceibacterota bacterium]
MPPNEQRSAQMKKIRDELLVATNAPLYEYRTENKYFPVVGEGSHEASIMFVGEAPGQNEAKTGKPFCGRAGKILDELLASINLPREKVYITNIVKDRPPGNRDPYPDEIAYYGTFLDRQIDIIKPKVIATLGRFSMEYIMKKFGLHANFAPISKIHGQMFGVGGDSSIKIVPLYHPAVAIYNQSSKDDLKKDFQILKQFI